MSKVLSFEDKRKENIEKKKRSFERVLFDEFLGTYTELDDNGSSYAITMLDISRTGCSFQVPAQKKNSQHFQMDSDITLRFYFTKKSFIPVLVKIKHSSKHQENGMEYVRYGGEFDTSLPSFEPVKLFIEFVYKFAQYSVIDDHVKRVYFL